MNAASASPAASRHEAAVERRYTEEAEVDKGSVVEVYKGRKVPVGTVGTVFWIGEGRWGWRVGLNDDDTGETYWTALSNVRAVIADKDADESWVEYDARKQAEAAEAEAKRVNQWDEVVVLADPEFRGKVFWANGSGRLGVARRGARRVRNSSGQLRNKPEDVRWCTEEEVCKEHLYTAPEPEEADEPELDDFEDDDLGCF